MAKLLGPNIDSVKKAYLANLARHEGFNVLKELGEDFCVQAKNAAVSLDPMDPQYDQKSKLLLLIARTANDFCSSFFGSVEWHVREELELQKRLELESLFKQEVV